VKQWLPGAKNKKANFGHKMFQNELFTKKKDNFPKQALKYTIFLHIKMTKCSNHFISG